MRRRETATLKAASDAITDAPADEFLQPTHARIVRTMQRRSKLLTEHQTPGSRNLRGRRAGDSALDRVSERRGGTDRQWLQVCALGCDHERFAVGGLPDVRHGEEIGTKSIGAHERLTACQSAFPPNNRTARISWRSPRLLPVTTSGFRTWEPK